MNTTRGHSPLFRYTAAALLLLALPSCAVFQPHSGHKTKHAKQSVKAPHYQADAFVEHLSLALLGDDMDNNVDIVRAYGAAHPKTERLTILVISYKTTDNKSMQQIVAPVDNGDLSALSNIMTVLKATSPELHDLRLLKTAVSLPSSFKLPENDSDELPGALKEQQKNLIDNGQKLAPLDDAQKQLQLIGFFTKNGFRDAAYLAVDNVKRTLASASSASADAAKIKELSKQLDTLEGELHTAMPFTL
jgi:hypothetical protein